MPTQEHCHHYHQLKHQSGSDLLGQRHQDQGSEAYPQKSIQQKCWSHLLQIDLKSNLNAIGYQDNIVAHHIHGELTLHTINIDGIALTFGNQGVATSRILINNDLVSTAPVAIVKLSSAPAMAT